MSDVHRAPGSGLWSIVLAAGGSRRFDGNKLAVVAAGRSLLEHAVAGACAVTGARTVVVLGARAGLNRVALEGRGVRIVVNRRWRQGLATSLAAGIGALPHSARGALVLLADQHAVGAADLARLCRTWTRARGRPVAAGLDGLPVAPAILPRGLFASASRLSGDQGARALLRDPAHGTVLVSMPAAGIDLDRRADVAHFRSRARRPPGGRRLRPG